MDALVELRGFAGQRVLAFLPLGILRLNALLRRGHGGREPFLALERLENPRLLVGALGLEELDLVEEGRVFLVGLDVVELPLQLRSLRRDRFHFLFDAAPREADLLQLLFRLVVRGFRKSHRVAQRLAALGNPILRAPRFQQARVLALQFEQRVQLRKQRSPPKKNGERASARPPCGVAGPGVGRAPPEAVGRRPRPYGGRCRD